jgi:dihydroorotate dehydrogenase electron transfer subunit
MTLVTEDGSGGIPGLVTEALQAYVDRARPHRASLYACGPLPMLRRVAEIAAATGLPAFVALEARMACGFGVCLGCVVPTRSGADRTPQYRRVCVEGPIFRAEEVVWDEL